MGKTKKLRDQQPKQDHKHHKPGGANHPGSGEGTRPNKKTTHVTGNGGEYHETEMERGKARAGQQHYMYVYVYIYTYIHIYIYTYIHIYIYTYIHIYIYTYIHIYIYTCIQLYTYIYIYIHTHAYSIYIYIYKCEKGRPFFRDRHLWIGRRGNEEALQGLLACIGLDDGVNGTL